MSSEREAEKAAFLSRAGLGAARREPLTGDASTRRYERLHLPSSSLIFMDQPPALESAPCPPDATPAERAAAGYNALARLAAGRVDAFVATAGWLRAQDLSAPEIIVADAPRGLAVLEDLGDDLYARLIAQGQDEAPLYDDAITTLARMHRAEPPAVLDYDGAQWPLLTYDEVALKTGGEIILEWLPKLRAELAFGSQAAAEWEAIWAPIRRRGEAGATVFCHRDYHAENLIWLPERAGPARVGLLDFQDALKAHPAWDMSMLLHDARRDVSPEIEARSLARYFELKPEVDRARFLADYHALGALNVVRILGIFARLVTRDAKPRYAALMPRLWGYLDRCLADPQMGALKAWMDAHVPASSRT
ncbi:MAG: aminoglycoside phosphotransferase [Phenylobacterium sp.]|nr:aminoglycoside phosphotransferase [Phenylobacterium sp.]